jgi:hypothetical protein
MPEQLDTYLNKHGLETLVTNIHNKFAPKESPVLTGTPTATTAETSDDSTRIATTAYVKAVVGNIGEAMHYKGTVGATHGTYPTLPSENYKAGDTYKVADAGTYAGKVCEIGDMIIASKDYAAGTASNDDWNVIQNNIDGAVTGPSSATDGNFAIFDGSTGKLIKNSDVSPSSFKTKQTAVSVTGGTLKGVASMSQNENGDVTLTLNDIQDGTTSQKGVVQLQGSIGANETTDTTAATPKAVRDAINDLDATVNSAGDTGVTPNFGLSVTEADGKITAVTVTSDNTASNTHDHGNITNGGKVGNTAGYSLITTTDGLVDAKNMAVSDPTASGDALAFIDTIEQSSDGQINPTKKNIPNAVASSSGTGGSAGLMTGADKEKLDSIAAGAEVNVQPDWEQTLTGADDYIKNKPTTLSAFTDDITQQTYVPTGTNSDKPISGAGVKAAIDGLDAEITSVDGRNVQVKVTETDGKVAAVNITADNSATRVSSATTGHLAGLDGNGDLTDSGKTTTDFVNSLKLGSSSGTELKDNNGDVVIPNASTSDAGVVQLAGSIGATVASENNKAATEKAVRDAINDLDVAAVGEAGKYIQAIGETDGKISATVETMDTTPTQSSTKAITSGAVYTALNDLGGTVVYVAMTDTYAAIGAYLTAKKVPVLKLTTSGTDEYYQLVKDTGTAYVFEKIEGNVSTTYTCTDGGTPSEWGAAVTKTLEDSANKVTSIRAAGTATNVAYPSEAAVRTELDAITSNSIPVVAGTNVSITATSNDVTIAVPDGTTSVKGAVQLTDAVNSTSTTTAATPNSVKTAYDLANSDAVIVGATSYATANAAATVGNVYLNFVTNNAVKNAHNIVGSGLAAVTSDGSGTITITGSDPAAISDADINSLFTSSGT